MNHPALDDALDRIGPAAIAVSGGIDSLTLAAVACSRTQKCSVYHAVSPAVPKRATRRVQAVARARGWRLTLIDAGDFADPAYRENPLNRCFHCKTNLYGAIAAHTALSILSGTNLDDLHDFRPGLDAARAHGVRHPFVEAGMTKSQVREAAREIGLAELADLPAAPCLSSRVTTGIPIDPEDLGVIEQVEEAGRHILGEVTLRCRLTPEGYHLAIDEKILRQLPASVATALSAEVRALLRPQDRFVGLAPYRMGSAFVGRRP